MGPDTLPSALLHEATELPRASANGRSSLTYLMVNFAPEWEAASKMVLRLRRELAGDIVTRVVGFNTRGELLRFGREGQRRFPAPMLLAGKRIVRAAIGRSDAIHLFASSGDRYLLPKVAGPNAVVSIAKGGTPIRKLERNVPNLRRFRFIIVESEMQRELLVQSGIPGSRIKLIYPAAPLSPHAAPPAGAPFTILFATSPLANGELLERGIHLTLHAAARLPDVRFVLAWRKRNYEPLKRLIQQMAVRNVQVLNGMQAMGSLYGEAHATVLPGLVHTSLKPCPLSLVESLAHGKPVLVSSPTQVSHVIAASGAGVVFEPRVDALCDAITELRDHYHVYQARCHPTAASTFSPDVFIAKHRAIYDELLHHAD